MDVSKTSEDEQQKPKQTQWWAAVSRGLVIDPQARHYKNMQKSVWLFLYLLQCANWDTGLVLRSYETMAKDTGISKRTIRLWLTQLRDHNYITVRSSGRGLVIHILKWKTMGRKRRVADSGPRVATTRQSE